MGKSKVGKHLTNRGGVNGKSGKSQQVDFLVWSDVIDGLSATETAGKLGVSRQAIEQRRAKIKAFIDPDGTLLPKWRGIINSLAVDAINTLHFHLTERKDKDLAIRILENIEALKRIDANQPSGGVNFNQFFGNGAADANGDKQGIRQNIAATYRF